MLIKAEKWIVGDKFYYKVYQVHICCDKILNSDNIDFNSKGHMGETDGDNTYSAKLVYRDYCYDGDIEHEYEEISYCPFCGKKIIVYITRERDETNEYQTLKAERDLLKEQCIKTDSKKQANLLNKQISELDDKINYITRTGNLI